MRAANWRLRSRRRLTTVPSHGRPSARWEHVPAVVAAMEAEGRPLSAAAAGPRRRGPVCQDRKQDCSILRCEWRAVGQFSVQF